VRQKVWSAGAPPASLCFAPIATTAFRYRRPENASSRLCACGCAPDSNESDCVSTTSSPRYTDPVHMLLSRTLYWQQHKRHTRW